MSEHAQKNPLIPAAEYSLKDLHDTCRPFARGLCGGVYTLVPLFHAFWGRIENWLQGGGGGKNLGIADVSVLVAEGHYKQNMYRVLVGKEKKPVVIMPVVADIYNPAIEGEWYMVQCIGLSGEQSAADALYRQLVRFADACAGTTDLYEELYIEACLALWEGQINLCTADIRRFYCPDDS